MQKLLKPRSIQQFIKTPRFLCLFQIRKKIYTMLIYTYSDFVILVCTTVIFAGITALFFGLALGDIIYKKTDSITYNFVTFLIMLVITLILTCLCIYEHGHI